MSYGRARLGVFACAVLGAGVVANILTQGPSHLRLNKMTPGVGISTPPPVQAAPAATPVVLPPPALPRGGEAPASDLVRAVQRELQARGYEPGGQNGMVSPVMRAAILAFEDDHKLPLTAEPSEALLKSILLGGAGVLKSPAPVPGGQAAGVEILLKTVHQNLAAMGYIGRRTDAKFGPELTRAIREFEMDQGVHPTGRITGPMVTRLLKASANRRPR